VVDNYYKADSFMKTNPPLLTVDKTSFNKYVELVRSRFFQEHIRLSDSLLASATVLIKELQTAYKLKDE
jgi:aspartyl/asparaginyl-tRNA synthetase